MSVSKIAITMDKELLKRLDRLVAALAIPIRSPGRSITLMSLLIRAREPNRIEDVVRALT